MWQHPLWDGAVWKWQKGNGTVFKINTNGTGFSILHNFSETYTNPPGSYTTNSDGSSPNGGLILSGNTLYGTAWTGGANGNGTVFEGDHEWHRFYDAA